MQNKGRVRHRRVRAMMALAASVSLLAACAGPHQETVKKPRSKEYFSEKEYGVKASPYAHAERLVGRNQVGKPYKVRGKWYYPKEYQEYSKVGTASWYGSAFHGRLTANGEVYNLADLTAAHPTMPLPSYARVTNLSNGSSVVVRVNDRGPFHDNRLIDLSQRAAQMLDYKKAGTAKVQVDYIGRAPLEGDDRPFLMASYKPGHQGPDPSDGLPHGVMIAMNGPSPNAGRAARGGLAAPATRPFALVAGVDGATTDGFALPDFGPIVPQRPDPAAPFAVAALSYADERVGQAADAFAAFEAGPLSADAVVLSWKKLYSEGRPAGAYVAAGSFDDESKVRRIAQELAGFGKVEIEKVAVGGGTRYVLNLYAAGQGQGDLDAMLRAAWAHGAPDAFAVRE